MTEYEVVWVINVDADTPEEAALKAQMLQRDPNSLATCYEVTPYCETHETYHDEAVLFIDLAPHNGHLQ